VKITDGYLIREFVGPFLMAVFGISIVFISGLLFELSDLLIVRQASFALVGKLLIYSIPGILVEALPLSVLFATILSLGRLTKDSELMVLQVSGYKFLRLLFPLVFVALIISLSSYFLNETVVPWTNHKSQNVIRMITYEEQLVTVQENTFFKAPDNRYFYIGRVDEATHELSNILVYEVRRGGPPNIITAAKGFYQDETWELFDGVVHEFDDSGFVKFESKFDRMVISVDMDFLNYLGQQKSSYEMSRKELKEHIERFSKGGVSMGQYWVDYHLKLSIPLAGFIFLLLGAPLSLGSARSGVFFGIALSIGISFLYYIVLAVLRSMAGNGYMNPLLAAWLPNIVFALIGLVLIVKRDSR
jgi:lipopolysaccharide export system permease protein